MSAKPTVPGKSASRPLSPFMIGPYYRPQLTSMLSITHRLTGISLALGTIFVAIWVTAAASGAEAYAVFSSYAHSIIGYLLLVAYSWALLYHLCNGIRHLFWDTGRGFELKAAYASGKAVIAASVLLTILVWVAALVA